MRKITIEEARQIALGALPKRPHKYRARGCRYDGIWFGSQAEKRRYQLLLSQQISGSITGLIVHPRYQIRVGGTLPGGRKIRSEIYEADFQYDEIEEGGKRRVVEDVKGVETPTFKQKSATFQLQYPQYEFIVVPAKEC
jgi:hypothetical protein